MVLLLVRIQSVIFFIEAEFKLLLTHHISFMKVVVWTGYGKYIGQ